MTKIAGNYQREMEMSAKDLSIHEAAVWVAVILSPALFKARLSGFGHLIAKTIASLGALSKSEKNSPGMERMLASITERYSEFSDVSTDVGKIATLLMVATQSIELYYSYHGDGNEIETNMQKIRLISWMSQNNELIDVDSGKRCADIIKEIKDISNITIKKNIILKSIPDAEVGKFISENF